MSQKIAVEVRVKTPVEKVWQLWNEPEHIKEWAFASSDWHVPSAENDAVVGGRFVTRMESKDGSQGFDFGGTYTVVEPEKRIEYKMDDGREVSVEFVTAESPEDPETHETVIREMFDPEHENSEEMQKAGWQAILDNFKKYAESKI